MLTSDADDNTSVSVPLMIPELNAPPPFLCKTYDIVDDPSTDAVVSWSSRNNSFVIWSAPEFGRDLLPLYFKHSNFSSFVRQLNTYGFRKVHPDRWEFAHEGFLRGKKQLLKTIKRRKASHGPPIQPQLEMPQVQIPAANACVEVEKIGIEEDVEMLKREKNVLMQELVKLRQKQQSTEEKLDMALGHIQVMDQRQQKLISFLAKAFQSPGFFTQFFQEQTQNNRHISEHNKKRRLKQDDVPVDDSSSDQGCQIVKYQPFFNEAATSYLSTLMDNNSSLLEFRNNDQNNFTFDDASSSTDWKHGGDTCMDNVVKISIPETPSSQVSTTPASVIPPCGSPNDAVDVLSPGVGVCSDMGIIVHYPNVSPLVDMHDCNLTSGVQSEPGDSSFVNMVPEITVEIPENDHMEFDLSKNDLIKNLFDIDIISPVNDDIDTTEFRNLWTSLQKEIDSAQKDELANGREMLLTGDKLGNSHNIECFTDQMGLTSSGAKTTDSISVWRSEV